MSDDYKKNFNDDEEEDFFENKLRKQLEKQLFWWVKVNGKAEGVLVFVGKDFIVLVDDCKIIEVNLDEIETITKRAIGCPCRRCDDHDHHHHDHDYDD